MSAIEEKLEVVKKRIAAAKARSPYRQDVGGFVEGRCHQSL